MADNSLLFVRIFVWVFELDIVQFLTNLLKFRFSVELLFSTLVFFNLHWRNCFGLSLYFCFHFLNLILYHIFCVFLNINFAFVASWTPNWFFVNDFFQLQFGCFLLFRALIYLYRSCESYVFLCMPFLPAVFLIFLDVIWCCIFYYWISHSEILYHIYTLCFDVFNLFSKLILLILYHLVPYLIILYFLGRHIHHIFCLKHLFIHVLTPTLEPGYIFGYFIINFHNLFDLFSLLLKNMLRNQ